MLALLLPLFVLFSLLLTSLSFFFNRKHLLKSLILLELMITLIFFSLLAKSLGPLTLFNLMYTLIFAVCESALGLSLLILLTRTQGSDNLNSLNLMQW